MQAYYPKSRIVQNQYTNGGEFVLTETKEQMAGTTCLNKNKKSDLLICHKCDTPRCCNPEHLQLGTIQQNALDSLNYSKAVKLTENDVREIKTCLKDNSLTNDELSKKYNISKTAVKQVCGVSEVTINKCFKKLENMKDKLVPQCILDKY